VLSKLFNANPGDCGHLTIFTGGKATTFNISHYSNLIEASCAIPLILTIRQSSRLNRKLLIVKFKVKGLLP
jgi:hypothetical protein